MKVSSAFNAEPEPDFSPAGPTVADRIAAAGLRQIGLQLLLESPTNPRKHFDPKAVAELAADLAKHGVLEPILVRRSPADSMSFEVVFGARRVRAASIAGLESVPAREAALTDVEVIELQLAENLQRADLHPMEEAEAYELLHREHGLTVKQIADRYAVGKSESYVYARMRLCAIKDKAARAAFLAGEIDASTSLLIARIPNEKLQREFAKRVLQGETRSGYTHGKTGDPLSHREALVVYHREFMLELSSAPWRKDDAELVPAAGACTNCPKRTGNQKDLFSDVKSADVCTDTACFQSKKTAFTARRIAEAKSKGQDVIEGRRAKEILPYQHSAPQAGVVELDARCYEDPKARTYRTLLHKVAEDPSARPSVVVSPHDGSLHEVLDEKVATRLLKEAGHKFATSTRPSTNAGLSKRAAERAKAERAKTILENKARAQAVVQVSERVATPLGAEDLRLVAEMFFSEMHHETRKQLLDGIAVSWQKGKHGGYELVVPFRKFVAGLDAANLATLLVVMSISPRDYWQDRKDPLPDVAKRYKVDLAKLRKEVAADSAKPKAANKGRAA